MAKPEHYSHTKVSGPWKSFFEGTAGVFGFLTAMLILGAIFSEHRSIEGVFVILFFAGLSAVSYGISTLIPSKNQVTQK